MICTILRSDLKPLTYLYLAPDQLFDDLPAPLRQQFGVPEQVMELDLAQREKLAHADIAQVREALRVNGYYLQLPPEVPVEEEIARWLQR